MAKTNSSDQNQQFLSETEKLLELDAAQLSTGHRQPALDHLEKVRGLQDPSAELTSKCKQLFERLSETAPDRITQLVALGEKEDAPSNTLHWSSCETPRSTIFCQST